MMYLTLIIPQFVKNFTTITKKALVELATGARVKAYES